MDKIKCPLVAVDVIIEIADKILLIKRNYPPIGYALVGGFVNYGESLEAAAYREAREETGLDVELIAQLHTYSEPNRDPRAHVISTVFIGKVDTSQVDKIKLSDEVKQIKLFKLEKVEDIPSKLVFDHKKILTDYLLYKERLLITKTS